jgi:ATP-binding cassette, subfamily B, bacterial
MRSFRRDDSIRSYKLSPGIVRRIIAFARPYRRKLAVFLALIVIDALLGAANPLLYRAIIDDGILTRNSAFIVEIGAILVVLAITDAGLSLWQRWISARIGEGLIFQMRTQVFAHFQEMPIAFFTRTQTGALVSRLNSDVTDAQQAFTDTFSSVIGNAIGVEIGRAHV